MNKPISTTNHQALSHLNKETWGIANRELIKKAISEFAHEKIFLPFLIEEKDNGWTTYKLATDNPSISYLFDATKQALDHWHIDEKSIEKQSEEPVNGLNMLTFIIETQKTLGIPDEFLPTYLEEITSTLSGKAYKLNKPSPSSRELINSDFQTIEHAMTEGHPCFVANNGRLGFDSDEYHLYAPEADHSFSVLWVAGHKSRAAFHSISTIDYDQFLLGELGKETVIDFQAKLLAKDLDPNEYVFIPVHPWQWKHKISSIFAHDIANQYLVLLGESDDLYSAQQSIRTLYNQTNPEKYYVKAALSILNMGFMRGLSPYYMESTPRITEWIEELLGKDPILRACGFEMLKELATVGYRNLLYEPLGKPLAHNKMLSALWRESPIIKTSKDQQLMTMAGLLHVDKEGDALVIEMINASSLSAEQWIAQYLNCYLKPLIHCFYRYELVFMPHGENLILVMENHVPIKAIMKDITEEVIVFNEEMKLEGHAKRLLKETSDEMKLTYIFTDVFDCFFRFLSNILTAKGGYSEQLFWGEVAKCIRNYQLENPDLQAKYKRYNFFQKEFRRCCLNRLQLKNTKQMLNLSDPFGSLQWEGVLDNPIYSPP